MNEEKLLEYYEKELQFLRDTGTEFAKRFPGVASRLDLGGFKCSDPYVERLLEGFAFLTARIQYKIDAEYPKFTQNLLNMVYPHYLSPIPSMAIVKFDADMSGSLTGDGFLLPRGSRLKTDEGSNYTRCEFRTAHQVALWPVELRQATYLSTAEANYYAGALSGVKSGIHLKLHSAESTPFNTIKMDDLIFYIDGSGEIAGRLYELLSGKTHSIVIRPDRQNLASLWEQRLPSSVLSPIGFSEEEALLPYTDASFQGYRLLQEYYALPERFLFFQLSGLGKAIKYCTENDKVLDIIILFSEKNDLLQNAISHSNFSLHCTPTINLFPKRANRIHLSPKHNKYHVIVERTAPFDYEVHSITKVTGFDTNLKEKQQFIPFYAHNANYASLADHSYYTLHREETLPPTNEKRKRKYAGSDVYLSLVDEAEAPYSPDLKQLAVEALCTNRGLPLEIAANKGRIIFTLEDSAPITTVQSLAGPTMPHRSYQDGEHAWRLISQLSLNYLSLLDKDSKEGASALRELLRLYSHTSSLSTKKQIDGILNVTSNPLIQRLPGAGPITFGRGIEIQLFCQENSFDGTGVFILGSVLERFFSKYVSINSFTQTVLISSERGELMRWPVRSGTATIL